MTYEHWRLVRKSAITLLCFYLVALSFAVVTARATSNAKKGWASFSLVEQKEFVKETIRHDKQSIRWWVNHRRSTVDVFLTKFVSRLGFPQLPACGVLGFRAPVALCLKAHQLRHAEGVLERLDSTLTETNDWVSAVRVVQQVYPGSEQWLLACSSSEGGHGVWQWRSPNGFLRYTSDGSPIYVADIPGGPMQYFKSTFDTDFNAAVTDLRQRGIRVPRSAFSWYSNLGQALAGGWAWGHARPSGKWTGGRC